ncbi:MAG: hypothetical protein KGI70_02215 [Patescibacteria group bacterium]|nr:hypothetical protein [Patescibacteria group bacterium]
MQQFIWGIPMTTYLKSKWTWLAVTLVALFVEHNLGINTATWLVSWIVWATPADYQGFFWMAIVMVAIALVAAFGWLGVGLLVVLVVWPVTNANFGVVDEYFYSWAQMMAKNPRNLHEVYAIFQWFHYGSVAVGLVLLAVLCWPAKKAPAPQLRRTR